MANALHIYLINLYSGYIFYKNIRCTRIYVFRLYTVRYRANKHKQRKFYSCNRYILQKFRYSTMSKNWPTRFVRIWWKWSQFGNSTLQFSQRIVRAKRNPSGMYRKDKSFSSINHILELRANRRGNCWTLRRINSACHRKIVDYLSTISNKRIFRKTINH